MYKRMLFLLFLVVPLHAMIDLPDRFEVIRFAPMPSPEDVQQTLNWKLTHAVIDPEAIDEVEQLLAQGADINARSAAMGFTYSIFEFALVMHQNRANAERLEAYQKLFSLLVHAGADLNGEFDPENISLIAATRMNNFAVVKLFLRWGANPDKVLVNGALINTTVATKCWSISSNALSDGLDELDILLDEYNRARYMNLRPYPMLNEIKRLKIRISECEKIKELMTGDNFRKEYRHFDDNPRTKKWRKTDTNIANALMNREMGIK